MQTELDTMTTRQLNRLRRRIKHVYETAKAEMQDQLTEFIERFKELDEYKRTQLENGNISADDYRTWLRNQVFQSEQLKAKIDNITDICTKTQSTAYKMARHEQYAIFANGANFAYYSLEKQAGASLNLTIYNTTAVQRLLTEQPRILPNKQIKSASNKTYDAKVFNRYVTQGIIQGKNVTEIATQAVNGMADTEMHWAENNAITALTSAQNAGTLQQLKEAKAMGLDVKKQWNATLDYHTRETHRLLDQQTAELEEPFKVLGYQIDYPADPHAAPEMVYHCRCRLTGVFGKYKPENAQRRDNVNKQVVNNQSYEEWYSSKQKQTEQSFRSSAVDRSQSLTLATKHGSLTAYKVPASKYELYFTDNVQLKPKELHQMELMLDDVYSMLGNPTESRPTVVLVSDSELNSGSIATYNAMQNTIRIYSGLATESIDTISKLQADGVCPDDRRSTLLHEHIHWQDAQEYQRLYGKIKTNTDASKYIDWIRQKAEKWLYKAASKGYNVSEISEYALKSFKDCEYDETYTEYRVKQALSK